MASIIRINGGHPATDSHVADRPEIMAQAGLTLLERLPLAVFVVCPDGRLLHANPRGRAMMGVALHLDVERRCCAGSSAATFILRSKIAEAATAGRRSEFTLARESGLPLAACVLPLAGMNGASSLAALVVVGDAERTSDVAPEFLEDLFGLTAAEARVAVAVSNGRRLEAIAAEHGISMNTVRCYLKQIFAKLDISRQADLVRLVLNGPGALPADPGAEAANGGLCRPLDLGQTDDPSAEDRGGPCVRNWSSDSGVAANSPPCQPTTSPPSSPPAPGDPTAGDS